MRVDSYSVTCAWKSLLLICGRVAIRNVIRQVHSAFGNHIIALLATFTAKEAYWRANAEQFLCIASCQSFDIESPLQNKSLYLERTFDAARKTIDCMTEVVFNFMTTWRISIKIG